jgi:hypothetical protein
LGILAKHIVAAAVAAEPCRRIRRDRGLER